MKELNKELLERYSVLLGVDVSEKQQRLDYFQPKYAAWYDLYYNRDYTFSQIAKATGIDYERIRFGAGRFWILVFLEDRQALSLLEKIKDI